MSAFFRFSSNQPQTKSRSRKVSLFARKLLKVSVFLDLNLSRLRELLSLPRWSSRRELENNYEHHPRWIINAWKTHEIEFSSCLVSFSMWNNSEHRAFITLIRYFTLHLPDIKLTRPRCQLEVKLALSSFIFNEMHCAMIFYIKNKHKFHFE